jgi:hypothetical protein
MRTPSDTKRPRAVKAEFDPDFQATPMGGAILAEKTLRSLGMIRYVREYLPDRSPHAGFTTPDCAYAILAGMMLGGQGMQAAEALRQDKDQARMFGFPDGVPSPSTTYRALCDLSGLPERKEEDWYKPAGASLPALDMFGEESKPKRLHRMVPDVPESASPERRLQLEAFLLQSAIRCLSRLHQQTLCLSDWVVAFLDATDLEVEGNCFDAAAMGREGKKILRLLTFLVGPIVAAYDLCEGNRDEGRGMPAVIRQGMRAIAALGRKGKRVLALMDAAYFEKQVIEALEAAWDFIVCANQQRDSLTRLAQEQPEWIWADTGADAGRGWRTSQTCCFTHLPEGWEKPVTIVTRRWQKDDEIAGVWHYSFLATRLEASALPKKMLRAHGYCSAIWMLYGTKQGRENHYKTPLRDFGLHHPRSGRLGINQAYYALGLAASNVAMVMRYRVLAAPDRGMTFWRIREMYFRIAGYLVQGARYLTVRLSGVNVDAKRQVLWRKAFAAAGQL